MHHYFTKKISGYLPEFVYGSIDGTVTTFAIISGIAGANLDASIVLILGFSNVLADGFSMASSNYLSEESHQAQITSLIGKTTPWKTALVTFISFILVGSMPMIAYVLAPFIPSLQGNEFLVASIITGITFVIIGTIRGKVADVHILKTALQTLCIGAIAAGVSYGVGAFLGNIIQ